MIQFDREYNQNVHQQFLTDCQSIKDKITALLTFNNQLSGRLQSLIDHNKAIQAKCVTALYPQTYSSFYDAYAPKLWGLIVGAHLSDSLAEAILINTLTKAWHQFDHTALGDNYVLSRLLTLAYAEGLPMDGLKAIVRPKA